MSDDEVQAQLADIEERIESLRDMIESCRKGMLASNAAIAAGAIVLLADLFGLFGSVSLLLALSCFTAIIGGIVWLGANKTSREQASASLRAAQSEWQAATNALEMSTIGEWHSR
ncbi:MAG: hypothetical protein JO004_04720 [Methylobacteriaceae bacterium]|nr:hypothetical protein [Methylobacteriaceae bacterium]